MCKNIRFVLVLIVHFYKSCIMTCLYLFFLYCLLYSKVRDLNSFYNCIKIPLTFFCRVRECQVLFLAGKTKGCFYAPPYLDDYGETDQGLR